MGSDILWDNVKFGSSDEIDNINLCEQWADVSLNLDDEQSNINNKHVRFNSIDWQLCNSVVGCYDNYNHDFMGGNECPHRGGMTTEHGDMLEIAPQDIKIMRSWVKITH